MAHASDLIAENIDAYLTSHQYKSLLRFITCGSVDDGKSTLIGRLLYDSKMIFEDQLAALEADSKRDGTQGDNIDFALLVDGLAAEHRAQRLARTLHVPVPVCPHVSAHRSEFAFESHDVCMCLCDEGRPAARWRSPRRAAGPATEPAAPGAGRAPPLGWA